MKKDEQVQLRRARLVERIRTVEKQKKAAEVFAAVGHRRRLEEVTQKTFGMAEHYVAPAKAGEVYDLAKRMHLSARMTLLAREARRQNAEADVVLSQKLAELGGADQREKSARDRVKKVRRSLQAGVHTAFDRLLRKNGTELD